MGDAVLTTAMILPFAVLLSRRHLRTLRRPAADVPRSDRLFAWAVVSFWSLLLAAGWVCLSDDVTVVLVSVLVWLAAPPVLAVAAARCRRTERREEDLLRATQGLPVRRHLASPWTVAAGWAVVAVLLLLGIAVGPALATAHGQPVQRDAHTLYLVYIPTVLGAAHTIAQYARREQETVRAARADRLAAGLEKTAAS
ncbi:hypothetical protein AB0D10_42815 [Kitasatospora sp. NPDC048545]|uniref:hypothetical protein n=1 Tax=Kitasatospora sp. NPDC048545 TaxID=3157208 RepID=UPI0033C0B8C4